MAAWMFPYRSRVQPNTSDGKNTRAAHSGGWLNRCIAANTVDVITLASDKPTTERDSFSRLCNSLCNPPRKINSSSIGYSKPESNSEDNDSLPMFSGTPSCWSMNQHSGPIAKATQNGQSRQNKTARCFAREFNNRYTIVSTSDGACTSAAA